MKHIYNKKKFNFLNRRRFIIYLVSFFFVFCLFFSINELKDKSNFHNFIQIFSDKFDYNFKLYNVNTLNRVDKIEIFKIMDQYLNQSIFLIPLNKISESFNNIKWVKQTRLKTNLKNKINIYITEYEPIGLYSFNDKLFYFSDKGKIIDQLKLETKKNYIIFYGKQSLKNVSYFFKIINKIKQSDLLKIKEAYFINDRRWNVKLDNGVILYLSEKSFETSLINYIKLREKLINSEITSIISIDLRDDKKAIINFKKHD